MTTPDGYEALLRCLTGQPEVEPPPVGQRKALPPKDSKSSFSPKHWRLPRLRSPFYTDHPNGIWRVREALAAAAAGTRGQVAILCGTAGSGKTALALEYVHSFRSCYSAVFWVSAFSPEALLSELTAMALSLGLLKPGIEIDYHAVVDCLKSWMTTNEDWIIVFDGLDMPEELRALLPATHGGHVLLTCRQYANELADLGTIVDLTEKTSQDCTVGRLLLRWCDFVDDRQLLRSDAFETLEACLRELEAIVVLEATFSKLKVTRARSGYSQHNGQIRSRDRYCNKAQLGLRRSPNARSFVPGCAGYGRTKRFTADRLKMPSSLIDELVSAIYASAWIDVEIARAVYSWTLLKEEEDTAMAKKRSSFGRLSRFRVISGYDDDRDRTAQTLDVKRLTGMLESRSLKPLQERECTVAGCHRAATLEMVGGRLAEECSTIDTNYVDTSDFQLFCRN